MMKIIDFDINISSRNWNQHALLKYLGNFHVYNSITVILGGNVAFQIIVMHNYGFHMMKIVDFDINIYSRSLNSHALNLKYLGNFHLL